MEKIILLVVFTLPGLLTYILAQFFGTAPSYKSKGNEVLLVTFFLWIPIVMIIMFCYQIMAWLSRWEFLHSSIDYPILKKNWVYFGEMSDLLDLANNPLFLLYYFIMSIFLSYLISKKLYGKIFSILQKKVNRIREENEMAPISKDSLIWEKAFSNNEAQIINVVNLTTGDSVIGEIESVSGSLDNERDMLLRHTKHWTDILKAYEVEVVNIYVDIKSGHKIEIFSKDHCLIAQGLYLEESQK